MSSIDTNCISNTEFALRIIIPCTNTLLGALTYIYNDDLLNPVDMRNMHIAIATVNVILMLLSLINEILKNRFDSIKKYNDEIRMNSRIPSRDTHRISILLAPTPKKPSVLKDLVPFKVKLK